MNNKDSEPDLEKAAHRARTRTLASSTRAICSRLYNCTLPSTYSTSASSVPGDQGKKQERHAFMAPRSQSTNAHNTSARRPGAPNRVESGGRDGRSSNPPGAWCTSEKLKLGCAGLRRSSREGSRLELLVCSSYAYTYTAYGASRSIGLLVVLVLVLVLVSASGTWHLHVRAASTGRGRHERCPPRVSGRAWQGWQGWFHMRTRPARRDALNVQRSKCRRMIQVLHRACSVQGDHELATPYSLFTYV